MHEILKRAALTLQNVLPESRAAQHKLRGASRTLSANCAEQLGQASTTQVASGCSQLRDPRIEKPGDNSQSSSHMHKVWSSISTFGDRRKPQVMRHALRGKKRMICQHLTSALWYLSFPNAQQVIMIQDCFRWSRWAATVQRAAQLARLSWLHSCRLIAYIFHSGCRFIAAALV